MKKEYIFLAVIFLAVFGARLFFAFQTPYFSSDEAYYNIRQVVNIKKTLFPIISDDLSYGGKTLYLPPLFFYVMAALGFMFKTEFAGKFFPNLFASTTVVVAYLIAGQMTKKEIPRLLTALMAGFMPIFFSATLNSISIYSFIIPIMFFTIYYMMRVINKEKRFIGFFITSLLILRISTPIAAFLIFALLVYLIFIFLEKLKRSKAETELILFSTLLITWTLFISFKTAFLEHGMAVLWQNIPREILKNYFAKTNLLTAVYFIGIVPFVFGLYTLYRYTFREKDKKVYLLVSFAAVTAFLMWLRLIDLKLALIFIGFVMTFLFAKSYTLLLNRSRGRGIKIALNLLLLLLIMVSSIAPAFVLASNEIKKAYTSHEIKALLWLRKGTDKGDIVLATLNEGHLIAAIGQRKNFIDTNFMFVNDINQRLEDAYKIYTTVSQTQAIALLNKYNISYVYFSDRAKKEYKINELSYGDDNCFEKVFSNEDVEIYKSLCIIEEK